MEPIGIITTKKTKWKEIRMNLFLFVLTILTTLLAGVLVSASFIISTVPSVNEENASFQKLIQNGLITDSILFCLAILTFLTAHEMGHYLMCRKYKIDATLPYFIPFPTIFGTMGAFIKIKSPITSRKALFDIGAAGPIAGFIFLVPWMFIGLKMSRIVPSTPSISKYYLQDPLLTQLIERLINIQLPVGYEISAHPVYIAAWFGAIATAINLIPVGQLDGGHIVYALFKNKSKMIYNLAFLATIIIGAVAFIENEYFGWAIWIIIVFFLLRKGHPPTMGENIELGKGRILISIAALIILILTFMPVPIRFTI